MALVVRRAVAGVPGRRRLRCWEIRACGYSPGGKAASGGLMVMVIVQPGWSLCSWRSRYFCCSSGEFRRV